MPALTRKHPRRNPRRQVTAAARVSAAQVTCAKVTAAQTAATELSDSVREALERLAVLGVHPTQLARLLDADNPERGGRACRELQNMTRPPKHVEKQKLKNLQRAQELIAQQEAINLLIGAGLSRGEIERQVGATMVAIKYWERGEKLARGARRTRLLLAAGRVREVAGDETAAAKSREAATTSKRKGKNSPVKALPPPTTTTTTGAAQTAADKDDRGGRAGTEKKRGMTRYSRAAGAERMAAMRAAGWWPPRVRARKLKRLIKDSGLAAAEWIKRWRISRAHFYHLLNPESDTLMDARLLAAIVASHAEVSRDAGEFDLIRRFERAMTTLFGAEYVGAGFARGDPKLKIALSVLARELQLSERHIRRYLPPYNTAWRRRRMRFTAEFIATLERLARKYGRII